MSEGALPEGFTLKEGIQTTAAGFKYPVDAPQAVSLKAIEDEYVKQGKNYEEVMLAIWNAGNEQGAKQGQKQAVRVAVEEDGDVAEAVLKHQASARGFIQGAPRGGGGARHESGLTAKERTALGTAVALEYSREGKMPTRDRMDEIAADLGISPGSLD